MAVSRLSLAAADFAAASGAGHYAAGFVGRLIGLLQDPAAAAVMLLLAALAIALVVRHRRRPPGGPRGSSCGHCRYDVAGLTTFTCPECGSDLREVGIVRTRRRFWASPYGPGQVAPLAWRLSIWTIASATLMLVLVLALIRPGLWPAVASSGVVVKIADKDRKSAPATTAADKKGYNNLRVHAERRRYTFGSQRWLPDSVGGRVAVQLTLPGFSVDHPRIEVDPQKDGYRYANPGGQEVREDKPFDENALVARVQAAGCEVNDDVRREIVSTIGIVERVRNQFTRDALGTDESAKELTTAAADVPFEWVRFHSSDPDPYYLAFLMPLAAVLVWGAGAAWVMHKHRREAPAVRSSGGWGDPSKAASDAPSARDKVAARTVSVMFTDMKDYTARSSRESRLGVLDMVRRHRELVQPVVRSHGGRIVKTIGDALLVAFDSSTSAVLAGLEIQSALRRHNWSAGSERDRLELRIAVSTGEVAVEDGDVFGECVNLASRVQSVAGPGEVLFTEVTFATINKREVRYEEVGDFEFKGVPGTVKVYRALQNQGAEAEA